jgi:hypothetical protein
MPLPLPLRAVLTICREHDAEDVYVTGTFDDWQKTVQLEKEGTVFKKSVELPKTKTQYKVRPDSAVRHGHAPAAWRACTPFRQPAPRADPG